MAGDRELFELSNGRCIMDEDLSDKMYIIKSYHPERDVYKRQALSSSPISYRSTSASSSVEKES